MIRKFTILLVVSLLAPACSLKSMSASMAIPIVEDQYITILEESDLEMAKLTLPVNLNTMEGMLKSNEENLSLLRKLSEGFCSYAYGFVEESDPERASKLYLRGRDYAVQALRVKGTPGNFTELGMDEFKTALDEVDLWGYPYLYWVGQCWGMWMLINLDNVEAIGDMPKIAMVMKKILDWNESFQFAGPHLFFGSYYASRPKMFGGNPEKAKAHFERNLELTENKYLLTKIFYAKTYAVQTQDKKLFLRLLNEVLKTPSDVLPEQRLANEVAKVKARKLIEDADDLF